MPRRARRELPGGLAHVTARGVRRQPLFVSEADALAYLGLLDFVTREVADWTVLAYCLMPNHVHLVVDAEIPELGLAMHRVNGLHAQRFHREQGYVGHVFQSRYWTKPIQDEAHLPESLRYVVMNPVRAGLSARPEHWRWSSYRATIGLASVPRFLDVERALASFDVDVAKRAGSSAASWRSCCRAAPTSRGQSPAFSPSPRPRGASRTRTRPRSAPRAGARGVRRGGRRR